MKGPEQRRTNSIIQVEGAIVTGIQGLQQHGPLPPRVQGECGDLRYQVGDIRHSGVAEVLRMNSNFAALSSKMLDGGGNI